MVELANAVLDPQRRFSRDEYYALAGTGVFDDERVELLDGIIVTMSPQRPRHAGTVQWLGDRLNAARARRFSVRTQSPLALGPFREPEPDLAIVDKGDYRDEHPRTAHLVIEVAESSLRKDRAKARMYAEAGIVEYWIVNPTGSCVEMKREPEDGQYRTQRVVRRSESVAPLCLPELDLSVDEIFGARNARPLAPRR